LVEPWDRGLAVMSNGFVEIEREMGIGDWDRGPALTAAVTAALAADNVLASLASGAGVRLAGTQHLGPLPQ
jgi:hypothetical protein